MSQCPCSLSTHQEEHIVTLRVEGRATMNQSPTVRRFAEQCLGAGAAALHLDLRDCTYMDSTFVGTMLYLHRAVGGRSHREFALISPSPECIRLLDQLGLCEVLPQTADAQVEQYDWTPLSAENEAGIGVQADVVQAHRELAQLGGPAGDVFRSIASELEAEIASRR